MPAGYHQRDHVPDPVIGYEVGKIVPEFARYAHRAGIAVDARHGVDVDGYDFQGQRTGLECVGTDHVVQRRQGVQARIEGLDYQVALDLQAGCCLSRWYRPRVALITYTSGVRLRASVSIHSPGTPASCTT